MRSRWSVAEASQLSEHRSSTKETDKGPVRDTSKACVTTGGLHSRSGEPRLTAPVLVACRILTFARSECCRVIQSKQYRLKL